MDIKYCRSWLVATQKKGHCYYFFKKSDTKISYKTSETGPLCPHVYLLVGDTSGMETGQDKH